MKGAVTPFTCLSPEAALQDLRNRLAQTRWPDPGTVADWSQGAPLAEVRALVAYWQEDYDWRRFETRLNGFPQFHTEIDGLGFHFLHVRSPHANALPIVLTHGWPGSVIEFLKLIGPLTDPTAHGGDVADAFHVVVPSLPGYGFSAKPTTPGWTLDRGVGRTYGPPRLYALRRPGWGLGRDHYDSDGAEAGAGPLRHPPQLSTGFPTPRAYVGAIG
jgi:epoxide hydrolase